MHVIKPGVLPENRTLYGACARCGCEVSATAGEVGKSKIVACPTEGCGSSIGVRPPAKGPPKWDDFKDK